MKQFHIMVDGFRSVTKESLTQAMDYFVDLLGRNLTSRERFMLQRQGLNINNSHYVIESAVVEFQFV